MVQAQYSQYSMDEIVSILKTVFSEACVFIDSMYEITKYDATRKDVTYTDNDILDIFLRHLYLNTNAPEEMVPKVKKWGKMHTVLEDSPDFSPSDDDLSEIRQILLAKSPEDLLPYVNSTGRSEILVKRRFEKNI